MSGGGSSGSSSGGTQITKSEPWAGQEAYLRDVFDRAQGQAGIQKVYYPGPTYARPSYLSQYCSVRDSYWATAFVIGWVFESNLIRNPFLRRMMSRTMVSYLAKVDAVVSADEKFLRQSFIAPAHGFRVWEAELFDR
jgi:hypothetical protein